MNKALKLLSTMVGIAVSGSLALTPAPVLSADPGQRESQWLSIGVPADLQSSEAAFAGDEEGNSLFSMDHEISRFSVRGGRINPSFGLAWDKATGLYGTDMAGDADAADLFSLSTGLKFEPPGWGTHSLSGRTFLLDDSADRNRFSNRNSAWPDRAAGAAADGALPSAFDLVLEGGGFPILPELTYRLALVNPSQGGALGENGAGFAAGLTTRFDLGNGLSVSPLIEAARLADSAGTKNRERQYWSTSMLTEWRNWNLGLTYTQRETDDPAAAAISEYQAQASIGYVFDFGLSADLGWYRLKEEDESSDQFGLRFTYPLRLGK